jgi:hypothetical protein
MNNVKCCTKCKVIKALECFRKRSDNKNLPTSWCRDCLNFRVRLMRPIVYAKRKEYVRMYNKEYNKNNKDKISINKRKYYLNNKDKKLAANREYLKNNRDKIIIKQRLNKARKYHSDPIFKAKENIRRLVALAFRNKNLDKPTTTQKILGVSSWQQFFDHLKGTSIKNYGIFDPNQDYHIDHIIPLVTAKTIDEIKALNHYSNLQFLTPIDNLKKGTKLVKNEQQQTMQFLNQSTHQLHNQ